MKKSKLFATGLVTLLTAVTLAACGANESTDIITMKGDTITVSEFYQQVKTDTAAQQVLLNMVINKVFDKNYGDKVSKEDVEAAFKETSAKYGDSFSAALTSAGLTVDTYKEQIRTNKLVEYAVKTAAEKEVNDEAYKAAYEAYTPEVTAQVIKLTDETKANEVLGQAQEGTDFTELVSANATLDKADKSGSITFDSTSTDVPVDVQTAIFALEAGQVGTQVIAVTDYATYSQAYYVVKLINKTPKSENWKDYEKTLKDVIASEKQNDAAFISQVVSKALQDANVKVKDEAFQSILANYLTAAASTSSSSSSSASNEASSSEAATETSEAETEAAETPATEEAPSETPAEETTEAPAELAEVPAEGQ